MSAATPQTAAKHMDSVKRNRQAEQRRVDEVIARAIREGTLTSASPYFGLSEAAYRAMR